MIHREIRGLLAEFALGRLGEQSRVEIEEHLVGCPGCRGWLETYDLLGGALRAQLAQEHPEAAELADWAVLDGELPGEATAHLMACPTCSRDLELLQAAVAEARGGAGHERPEARRRSEKHGAGAIAWTAAAALVFAVLAGPILLAPQGGSEGERILAGGSLTGDLTISARSIYASDVEIPSGSHIVFEGGEMVSLGEGFVVTSGSTFAAGTAVSPAH